MIVRKLGVLIAICFLISACNAPVYPLTKADVANSKNVIDQSEAKQYPPPAPVITQSGPYVDTKKVSLLQPPSWLKRNVTLNGSQLPFAFYVTEMLRDTGAFVNYDQSIDKKKTLSLDYTGTLEGALDDLATRADYHYNIDKKKNTITWSAFLTKTYDISFVPGTSQFQVGKAKGSAGESNGIAGSSVSGFNSSDEQYSKLMGDVSVWREMEETITSLISPEGKVHTSLATTTLTVHDHPGNIGNVTRYLAKMNRELSRQVRLQVQVVEVTLDNQFAFGIDWNLVYRAGNETVKLINLGFDTANSGASIDGSSTPASQFVFAATNPKSPWAGSSTIIQSLQLQGQVRVLTQPALVSLNNQVAQLAVQDMQNYIKEVSTTLNDNQSETSVITDTLSVGMMLYMLPKVQNSDVFLQVSSNLSELKALDSVAVGSGTASATEIQLPNITQRIINQRAVVPSGATLVLSGFKSIKDANADDKFFGFELLGGRAAQKKSIEIIILITPTILSSEDTMEEVS